MDSSQSKLSLLIKALDIVMWPAKTNQLQSEGTRPQTIFPPSLPSAMETCQSAVVSTTDSSEKNMHIGESRAKRILMTILQKSLNVLERARQGMMANLLIVQGSTIMLSVILSAMVFFPLGTITSTLQGQCLLFSRVYLSPIDSNQVKLDTDQTEFGSTSECDYTTFLSVMVTVAGLIFLWFLIHFGRVTDNKGSASGFLISVFLFYGILFVCVLVSSIKISAGFGYWCDNLNICKDDGDIRECQQLECDIFSKYSIQDYPNTSKIYTYFMLAEISSWVLTLVLFVECFVTSQRIYLDIKASFTEEEHLANKGNELSYSSKVGIVNIGSDDYVQASAEGALDNSPASVEQIIAEVTVHNDSTLKSTGSYEMTAIAGAPGVQMLAGTVAAKKQQELSEQDGEIDSDKPRSRRRKIRSKTQPTNELIENVDASENIKTETSMRQV